MIKQKIQQLRKEGHSYGEISKLIGISKSYSRKVSKHILMSDIGKKRYHNEVSGITKLIKLQTKLTKEKVRVIGNLLFDGSVNRSKHHFNIMYVNTSKKLVEEFMKDMEKCYGTNCPHLKEEQGSKLPYFRIKYSSKLIFEDLHKYFTTYSTSKKNCNSKKSFKISKLEYSRIFLQTFFTNEGSISNSGKISGDSKSKTIIELLSKILDRFKINHNICTYSKKDYGIFYKIYLKISKDNYLKFRNLNLFHNAVVSKGHNVGKLKTKILEKQMIKRKYIKKRWTAKSPSRIKIQYQ